MLYKKREPNLFTHSTLSHQSLPSLLADGRKQLFVSKGIIPHPSHEAAREQRCSLPGQKHRLGITQHAGSLQQHSSKRANRVL